MCTDIHNCSIFSAYNGIVLNTSHNEIFISFPFCFSYYPGLYSPNQGQGGGGDGVRRSHSIFPLSLQLKYGRVQGEMMTIIQKVFLNDYTYHMNKCLLVIPYLSLTKFVIKKVSWFTCPCYSGFCLSFSILK